MFGKFDSFVSFHRESQLLCRLEREKDRAIFASFVHLGIFHRNAKLLSYVLHDNMRGDHQVEISLIQRMIKFSNFYYKKFIFTNTRTYSCPIQNISHIFEGLPGVWGNKGHGHVLLGYKVTKENETVNTGTKASIREQGTREHKGNFVRNMDPPPVTPREALIFKLYNYFTSDLENYSRISRKQTVC